MGKVATHRQFATAAVNFQLHQCSIFSVRLARHLMERMARNLMIVKLVLLLSELMALAQKQTLQGIYNTDSNMKIAS